MKLTHDYTQLPEIFYTRMHPEKSPASELLLMNESLARDLGWDPEVLRQHPGYFTGSEVPAGAVPVAQAYSGHQFGYFTRLGDGRAILLGEREVNGVLYDLHLKGAGRTPYSRGGDGLAALAPMLREYLISEAMHSLGIPTTRSLAVATTGRTVQREMPHPGAVLTRVAASHIRVGTFQYALEAGGREAVRALAAYTLKRQGIVEGETPFRNLFYDVMEKQARLIAEWMAFGFIHGVMNTDNMALSGETIDYGPCAFMDIFHEDTVFSSIDRGGRYAYKNQPVIGKWNLARFAEVLLGAAEDAEKLLPELEQGLAMYDEHYRKAYYSRMANKIGLSRPEPADEALIDTLLQRMQEEGLDYTNTFAALTRGEPLDSALDTWQEKWQERMRNKGIDADAANERMKKNNPVLIPRNHVVERVLARGSRGDLTEFHAFLVRLQHPFDYATPVDAEYTQPMPEGQRAGYRTYCGT